MAQPIVLATMPVGFNLGCHRCGAESVEVAFSVAPESEHETPGTPRRYYIIDSGCEDHRVPTGFETAPIEPRQPRLTPATEATPRDDATLAMEREEGTPWLLHQWARDLDNLRLIHAVVITSGEPHGLCAAVLFHTRPVSARDVAINGRPAAGVCLACWAGVTRKPAPEPVIDVYATGPVITARPSPIDIAGVALVVTEAQYQEMSGEPPAFARVPSFETPESGETWHVVKSDGPAVTTQPQNTARVLTFYCGTSADRAYCTTATTGPMIHHAGPAASWCAPCASARSEEMRQEQNSAINASVRAMTQQIRDLPL